MGVDTSYTCTRAGFSTAAAPENGKRLFEALLAEVKKHHGNTCSGVFCADMQVTLSSDGHVTFILKS